MTLQLHDLRFLSRRTPLLSQVSMEIVAGEPHALLGGHASGKSLLCRLIAGLEIPSAGGMTLAGERYAPRSPAEALAKGVFLFSNRSRLSPPLTVPENLFIGREVAHRGWISVEKERLATREALAPVHGEDLPLKVPVSQLSASQQMRVEMARALLFKPRLCIFDTDLFQSNPADLETLHSFISKVAASGGMVLFASRSRSEVEPVCPRYTILRGGERVSSGYFRSLPAEATFHLMEGSAAHCPPSPLRHKGAKVFSTHVLSGQRAPRGVSLALHQGEIFGLIGLPGAGQTSLLQILSGLRSPLEGEIYYRGENITSLSAAERVQKGIAYLPASMEENDASLISEMSLTDNLLLARLSTLSRWGFFSKKQIEMRALDWLEKLHLFGRHPASLTRDLPLPSRRVLALGRLFYPRLQMLILDQPTLGLEAPMRSHLYGWFYELALQGKTILLTGSHLGELLKLCDTIGVMRNGVLAAVRPALAWTEKELTETATAGRPPLPGGEFTAL